MNKQQEQQYELARTLSLQYDEQSGAMFGCRSGYHICVMPPVNGLYTITASLKRMGQPPQKAEMAALNKSSKEITAASVKQHKVTASVKCKMGKQKNIDNLAAALNQLIGYFEQNGFEDCCESCSSTNGLELYNIGGAAMTLCPECYRSRAADVEIKQQTKQRKPENIAMGVVGALLGALIGGAVMLLIARLGYVSMWTGFIMGICTIKGYELLGGQLSKKGVVISAIVMMLMVLLSNRVDWAISIAEYFEVSFTDGFQNVSYLLREGVIDSGTYYLNLGMAVLFTAIGAVLAIVSAFKAKTLSGMVYKLGENAAIPTQEL